MLHQPQGEADLRAEHARRSIALDHAWIRWMIADLRWHLEKKYNADQPRDDHGRWSGGGGAQAPVKPDRVQLAANDDEVLYRRMHPDATYERDQRAKGSYNYWQRQPTQGIVDSLHTDNKERFNVKPDGTVQQGNTRLRVLEERGYDLRKLEPLVDGQPRRLRGGSTLDGGFGPRGGGAGGPRIPGIPKIL